MQREAAVKRRANFEDASKDQREAAARSLSRTRSLERRAHAAKDDAIKERHAMCAQVHFFRAERDKLMDKVRARLSACIAYTRTPATFKIQDPILKSIPNSQFTADCYLAKIALPATLRGPAEVGLKWPVVC